MAKSKPFPDLDSVIKTMRQKTLLKGFNRSQTQALRDWQGSSKEAGLEMRFTRAGGKVYGIPGLWQVKKGKKPLWKSGDTHARVTNPNVRMRKASGSSGSKWPNPGKRLPFGAGVLNFLKNRHGIDRVVTSKETRPTEWRGGNVSAHERRSGHVSAYRRGGHIRNTDQETTRLVESQKTFGEAYSMHPRDYKYIDRRNRFHFRKYLRTLKFTKKGRNAKFESTYLTGAK